MSFQTGLSGLAASSRSLDVIGHNIANANTVGMKSSRAEFGDVVASALGVGGGNGAGIGVAVETVSQQFSQGSVSVTGNNLDVAINGGGFFQLTLPDGSAAYSRAGQFKLDNLGNLVTNGGAKVMGIKPDPTTGEILLGGILEPLSLNADAGIPAAATMSISTTLNLDARAVINNGGDPTLTPPTLIPPLATYGTSITAYDGQGIPIPVSLYFTKSALNTWQVWTNDLSGSTPTPPATSLPPVQIGGDLVFDPATGAQDPSSTWLTPVAFGAFASVNGALNPLPNLDLSKVSQTGSAFSVAKLTQDGNRPGKLVGVNIDEKGIILGSYDNGKQVISGQLKLASFANMQGLAPIGSNNWAATTASGVAVDGVPGSGQFGAIRAGALEDSNVDLTAELVNMMTAQRSYQANAQTIKTQDQVLQTLVNLR